MNRELEKINKKRYEMDGLGEKFKKPVEERVKKSKFVGILSQMSDEEIKALGYCLLISPLVKEAIDCYSRAVEHGVQLYALEREYKKRTKLKEIE